MRDKNGLIIPERYTFKNRFSEPDTDGQWIFDPSNMIDVNTFGINRKEIMKNAKEIIAINKDWAIGNDEYSSTLYKNHVNQNTGVTTWKPKAHFGPGRYDQALCYLVDLKISELKKIEEIVDLINELKGQVLKFILVHVRAPSDDLKLVVGTQVDKKAKEPHDDTRPIEK